MSFQELYQRWEEFLSAPEARAFITQLSSRLAAPVPRGTSLGGHLVQAMAGGLDAMQRSQAQQAKQELENMIFRVKDERAQQELKQRAELFEKELAAKREMLEKELASDKEIALMRLLGGGAGRGDRTTEDELVAKVLGQTLSNMTALGQPVDPAQVFMLANTIRAAIRGTPMPFADLAQAGRPKEEESGPGWMDWAKGLPEATRKVVGEAWGALSSLGEGMRERLPAAPQPTMASEWVKEKVFPLVVDAWGRATGAASDLVERMKSAWAGGDEEKILADEEGRRRWEEFKTWVRNFDSEKQIALAKERAGEIKEWVTKNFDEKVRPVVQEFLENAASFLPNSRDLERVKYEVKRLVGSPEFNLEIFKRDAEVLKSLPEWISGTVREEVSRVVREDLPRWKEEVKRKFSEVARPIAEAFVENLVNNPPKTTYEALARVLPEDAPILKMLKDYEGRAPDRRLIDGYRRFMDWLSSLDPKAQVSMMMEAMRRYGESPPPQTYKEWLDRQVRELDVVLRRSREEIEREEGPMPPPYGQVVRERGRELERTARIGRVAEFLGGVFKDPRMTPAARRVLLYQVSREYPEIYEKTFEGLKRILGPEVLYQMLKE